MAANHYPSTDVVPGFAGRVLTDGCPCARAQCTPGRQALEPDRPEFPVLLAGLVFLGPVVAVVAAAWALAGNHTGQGIAAAAVSMLILGLLAFWGRSRRSKRQAPAGLSGQPLGTDAGGDRR